jgi:16S rRNA processing protein RimM
MIFEEIGYFSKTQGLKGQLQLNVTKDFDIKNCKAVVINLPSGQSPQFISEFRQSKNGFVILLEEIDSIEKAKPFVNKKVLVEDKFLIESEEDDFVGYKLIDESFGELGVIDEVEDAGANLILNITHKGKQVLLPFSDELVAKIDNSTKTIYYKAPEGLIGMYLA